MGWQIKVLEFFSSIRNPVLNLVFEIITASAEGLGLLIIISVVYWCINKKLGQKLGFVLLFSMIINGFIKNLVRAPRPFEKGVVTPLRRQTATGHSFPSGHTQIATTFWAVWMFHVREKWLYYLGMIMIALIGLSRIYLGVHWPIDVIAAIIVGFFCTILGQGLFEKIKEAKGTRLLIASSILLLVTLVLRFDSDYVAAVGGGTGFILGYMLERDYIIFSTRASFVVQIQKVLIGIFGLLLIYMSLKIVFPPSLLFRLIRYMLVSIWIMAGAPYIFKKVLTI